MKGVPSLPNTSDFSKEHNRMRFVIDQISKEF